MTVTDSECMLDFDHERTLCLRTLRNQIFYLWVQLLTNRRLFFLRDFQLEFGFCKTFYDQALHS